MGECLINHRGTSEPITYTLLQYLECNGNSYCVLNKPFGTYTDGYYVGNTDTIQITFVPTDGSTKNNTYAVYGVGDNAVAKSALKYQVEGTTSYTNGRIYMDFNEYTWTSDTNSWGKAQGDFCGVLEDVATYWKPCDNTQWQVNDPYCIRVVHNSSVDDVQSVCVASNKTHLEFAGGERGGFQQTGSGATTPAMNRQSSKQSNTYYEPLSIINDGSDFTVGTWAPGTSIYTRKTKVPHEPAIADATTSPYYSTGVPTWSEINIYKHIIKPPLTGQYHPALGGQVNEAGTALVGTGLVGMIYQVCVFETGDYANAIMQLVPAKHPNGRVGYYDILNDVFYPGRGDGFTAGPEIGYWEAD